MKKKYEAPKLLITVFCSEDVVRTSGGATFSFAEHDVDDFFVPYNY